jgi:hypothetical protein
MKFLSRMLLYALVIAMVSAGLSEILARGQSEGESLVHRFLFEFRRSEALTQRTEEVAQSIEIKRAVIDDLIADRVTLREATEQFRSANELIENDSEGMVATYRGPRTEKGLWRQVLAWVEMELSMRHDPQAEEITCRIKDEMGEQCPEPFEAYVEELVE